MDEGRLSIGDVVSVDGEGRSLTVPERETAPAATHHPQPGRGDDLQLRCDGVHA